jgi:hypothetical protein
MDNILFLSLVILGLQAAILIVNCVPLRRVSSSLLDDKNEATA